MTNGFDALDWSEPYFDRDFDTYYYHGDDDECALEDDGQEVSYPPSDQDLAFLPPGVDYRSKIFVPNSGTAFIRHLHIFRNTADEPVSTPFFLYFQSDHGTDTGVITTGSGDDVATEGDRWFTVTNSADAADPTAALVFAGDDPRQFVATPNDVYEYDDRFNDPTDGFRDGDDEPQLYWGSVVLQPGETRIFMDVQAVRDTDGDAESAAEAMAGNADYLFAGMSAEEKAALQNFLPPDVDSDGVDNDTDNCLRAANADQVNTDGADDGGDACDPDDDNDTLSDEVEAAIGTDPKRADTDGDGVNDNADQCPTQAGDQANGCRSEDRPPTVAFTAPADNALLNPAAANVLTADAADDRGIARVIFVDDGRVVCDDNAAPYTCAYAPTGNDVGSNTLSAVAVDSTNQTATAFKVVRLNRFRARRLSANTTPKSDGTFPFRFTTRGRLTLPERVTATQGCKGRVSIQVKARKNTISTRRARVNRACTYRSRVTFRVPKKFYSKRLKVTVRFLGNRAVAPKRAKRHFVRVG